MSGGYKVRQAQYASLCQVVITVAIREMSRRISQPMETYRRDSFWLGERVTLFQERGFSESVTPSGMSAPWLAFLKDSENVYGPCSSAKPES